MPHTGISKKNKPFSGYMYPLLYNCVRSRSHCSCDCSPTVRYKLYRQFFFCFSRDIINKGCRETRPPTKAYAISMIYNSLLHWYTFIFDCLTISLLLFRPAACEAYIIDSVNISVIYMRCPKTGRRYADRKKQGDKPLFLVLFLVFCGCYLIQ